MVELLSRHATPSTESAFIVEARTATVRQMRHRLAEGQGQMSADDEEPSVSLRLTLPSRDAWLLAWTRNFFHHSAGHDDPDAFLSALLAETFESVCGVLPDSVSECWTDPAAEREEARRAEREAEAERQSEAHFSERGPGGSADGTTPPVVELFQVADLDGRIIARARDLTTREVDLAQTLLEFHQLGGARALGFASERQYARERLGLSYSAFKSAVALARHWPGRVRDALAKRELGHEAARLVSRVARPETVDAWLARAKERTVKHLAEEVRVAELARDLGRPTRPPTLEEVRAVHQLESRLLSGDREAVVEAHGQMSARAGTVSQRMRVSPDTARFYRGLERATRHLLPNGMTFVALLCNVYWDTWHHYCERKEAYAHVYVRDLFTCSSPVCSRHDVTPHHVKFRSDGGTDDDDNVIALCTWCHLEGVHRGRIRVRGKAGKLRFEIGPIEVNGRRKVTGQRSSSRR
ncbi:MAG: HNH endonuclease signature motif containing protein [Polyangiaceae bacterium]